MSTNIVAAPTIADRPRTAVETRLAAAARRWRAGRRLKREAAAFTAALRAATGPSQRSELIALAAGERGETVSAHQATHLTRHLTRHLTTAMGAESS